MFSEVREEFNTLVENIKDNISAVNVYTDGVHKFIYKIEEDNADNNQSDLLSVVWA